MTCSLNRFKVSTEEEWLKIHASHGVIKDELAPSQPPSYRLVYLICECGHRLLKIKDK